MESWWKLGEGTGYSGGGELLLTKLSCAFCGEDGNFKLLSRLDRTNSSRKTLHYDIVQCESCGNYTIVLWSASRISRNMYDFRTLPYPLKVRKAPDVWPEAVGRFWLQAKKSQAEKSWDAAAVMARSALQVALRDKGAKGKNLFGEIDDLASRGDLPPLMKEWAHELRLLGNDPAHPAPDSQATSREDVADVLHFLDLLFTYLFSLPDNIRSYRRRKDAEQAGD